MEKTANILERLQRSSVMIIYILLCASLLVGGIRLLQNIFDEPGAGYALFILLFLLLGFTFGAWLWVVLTIPGRVSREFDTIKNKIATGEISTIKEFSQELALFLTDNFNFVSFDIVLSLVKIKYGNIIASDNLFKSDNETALKWLNLSKESQNVVYLGKLSFSNHKLHGYLIPIWFSSEWLGYFVVYTHTPLLWFYRQYLNNFEDLYVDDQVLHVLHSNDTSNARRLCQSTDAIAREIEANSIKSRKEYLTKILELLLKETGCKAGFIKPADENPFICANIREDQIKSLVIPVEDKTLRINKEDLPIMMVKIVNTDHGDITLALLNDHYESIILARSLLDGCLTLKIGKMYMKLAEKMND